MLRGARDVVGRHPLATIGTLLVGLAVGVAGALAAGSAPVAGPGGPPACSVVGRVAAPDGLGLDLWVQCDYRVSAITVKLANRRLTRLDESTELIGGGPSDSMSCRRSGRRRVDCAGQMPAFARLHARLTLDEGVCRNPRARLTVSAFGGLECTGECPAIAFRSLTPSPTNRLSTGCLGH
jgi:hypothetical protein